MHFVFLRTTMKFSGGTKLFFEYASYLRSEGHQVDVLVKRKEGALKKALDVTLVENFNSQTIPKCDLVVATTPNDVKQAWDCKNNRVVNFCQGFPIIEFEQRVSGEVVPLRFQKKGLMNKLRLMRKKKSWRKKIYKIDKIYRLPIPLITVSKSLQAILEQRYNQPVHLCLNGVSNNFFYPMKNKTRAKATPNRPLRIISVGPLDVSVKGITITYDTIKRLKQKGAPIHFTRVTPKAIDIEKKEPCVDQLIENVNSEEMGNILRSADVYISNSFKGEGFGLPALEALSCGLICILTPIPSYLSFSKRNDYCYFLQENNADATIECIQRILNSPEYEIDTISKNGLKVAADFSFENACKRFEQILVNLANSNKFQ